MFVSWKLYLGTLIDDFFHLHIDNPGAEGGYFLKSDGIEVDDAILSEGTAVIDADDDTFTIRDIGDADIASDREPGVRRRERPSEAIPRPQSRVLLPDFNLGALSHDFRRGFFGNDVFLLRFLDEFPVVRDDFVRDFANALLALLAHKALSPWKCRVFGFFGFKWNRLLCDFFADVYFDDGNFDTIRECPLRFRRDEVVCPEGNSLFIKELSYGAERRFAFSLPFFCLESVFFGGSEGDGGMRCKKRFFCWRECVALGKRNTRASEKSLDILSNEYCFRERQSFDGNLNREFFRWRRIFNRLTFRKQKYRRAADTNGAH